MRAFADTMVCRQPILTSLLVQYEGSSCTEPVRPPCMGCLICITNGAGNSVLATQGHQTGQHAPQEPCRSFVLRDVICTYCNACTDLDLCRDPNLQVLWVFRGLESLP